MSLCPVAHWWTNIGSGVLLASDAVKNHVGNLLWLFGLNGQAVFTKFISATTGASAPPEDRRLQNLNALMLPLALGSRTASEPGNPMPTTSDTGAHKVF
jgi:hypothetical protein